MLRVYGLESRVSGFRIPVKFRPKGVEKLEFRVSVCFRAGELFKALNPKASLKTPKAVNLKPDSFTRPALQQR